MPEYEYYNSKDDDYVMVEADSFEEAQHLMFGADENGEASPYDYHLYELLTIDGKF